MTVPTQSVMKPQYYLRTLVEGSHLQLSNSVLVVYCIDPISIYFSSCPQIVSSCIFQSIIKNINFRIWQIVLPSSRLRIPPAPVAPFPTAQDPPPRPKKSKAHFFLFCCSLALHCSDLPYPRGMLDWIWFCLGYVAVFPLVVIVPSKRVPASIHVSTLEGLSLCLYCSWIALSMCASSTPILL
jgi:hypothetical protein